MNAKKCKVLRHMAMSAVIGFRKGSISPETIYIDKVVKREKIPTDTLKPDGTPEYEVIEKITRSLGNCTRREYQQLKKEHPCKSH